MAPARIASALLGLSSAVLLLVVALAPAASAGSRSISDEQGDPAGDITRVTVRWNDGLNVVVRHAEALRAGDTYTAYVDTRPGRRGPEFKAFARPNSDVLGVRRISSWGDDGSAVRCPGFRARADALDSSAPVRFFVPGRCLGDPDGPVRVSVRFQRGSASDWAPGTRRLGPSVPRG